MNYHDGTLPSPEASRWPSGLECEILNK